MVGTFAIYGGGEVGPIQPNTKVVLRGARILEEGLLTSLGRTSYRRRG